MPQEAAPLARLLPASAGPALRFQFPAVCRTHGGHELLLVTGGMGGRRAGSAAEAVIKAWRPDLLVMAGVAGALAEDLNVGDLVAADAIIAHGQVITPTLIPSGAPSTHPPVWTGALLSHHRVLVTAAEKRSARGNPTHPHSPMAVEMETAAVAEVTRMNGVPWAAIRAVSDTANEALPLDFNRLRTPDGDLPVSRVAWAAVTSPGSIPGLIRLGRNTSTAATGLAAFLREWLAKL